MHVICPILEVPRGFPCSTQNNDDNTTPPGFLDSPFNSVFYKSSSLSFMSIMESVSSGISSSSKLSLKYIVLEFSPKSTDVESTIGISVCSVLGSLKFPARIFVHNVSAKYYHVSNTDTYEHRHSQGGTYHSSSCFLSFRLS